MTDGSISRATINNNWSKPTGDLNGCFAAIWTNAGGRLVSRSLTLKSPYGLPAAAGLDTLGLFPQAMVQVRDTALPVSVTLRAFSPLVPQDMMSSTIPAALFVFTIRNEARAPVDASVALSWENIIGVGGTVAKGAFADRTGNTVAAAPPAEGIFGMKMAGPSKPPADPANRFYYNAQGDYTLAAMPTTPDTVVTMAGWNALDKTPGWWAQFERDGTLAGAVSPGREGSVHPAGVLALKVSLKANESREIPFVVAWHTPRLYTLEGTEYGHFYQKLFADSGYTARFALQNRLAFAALTDEWQNRLLRSTLPPWLAHRLINDASILFTNTVYTRDSGLAGTAPGPPLFAILEQPGTTADLGAVDRRLHAHALLASFFPRLDLQELEQISKLQNPAGAIPRHLGNLDEGISGALAGSVGRAQESLLGASASFAYQIAQYYFWTGDQRFLDRFYPPAKHALEFAATQSLTAGSPVPTESDRGLLRGALAAGERIAAAMADRRFADQCREWGKATVPVTDPPALAAEQWMKAAIAVDQDVPPPYSPAVSPGPSLSALVTSAALAAQSGSADSALALMQQADRVIVEQLRSPWTYHDNGVAESAANGLAAPASWNVLQALNGPVFDPAAGRLSLTPRLPRGVRNLVTPVFAPGFWATLESRSALTRLHLQFRLDRLLPIASTYAPPAGQEKTPDKKSALPGGTLIIKQVILPAPPNSSLTLSASVNRSPLTGKSAPGGKGLIVFTPDAPIPLTTGQRLEFLFRP